MIIKSMSRKVPSFDQLIAYMDAGASGRDFNIYYNLYTRQPAGIEDEFMQNSQYLHRRKNGVFMYHEVISITRSQQLTERQQIEILRKVVYQYIQDRAQQNLVYGVLHDEKDDNLHYHLLISSNHAESSTRHRLSKADFDKVKRNLELYVLECHPELEQDKLISKDRSAKAAEEKEGISNRGREMQRRTGKTPDRDRVKANLERIFAAASSREELIELLDSERLQLYKRGKHWGVLDESTSRKHRFATLGVADAFKELDAKLSATDEPEASAKADSQQQGRQTAKPKAERVRKRAEAEPKASVKQESAKAEASIRPEQAKPEAQSKGVGRADDSIGGGQTEANATVRDAVSSSASPSVPDPLAEEQAARESELKAMRAEKAKRKAERNRQRWIRQVILESKAQTNRVLNSMKFQQRSFNSLKSWSYGRFRR